MAAGGRWTWPEDERALVDLQERLGAAAEVALAGGPWHLPGSPPPVGGCFVAHAPRGPGPGRAGDRSWAAAVTWRAVGPEAGARRVDHHLAGAAGVAGPRRADDVDAQAVVEARAACGYVPTLLALRDGPILAAAVSALEARPAVLLVDASGRDHPRGAGLAVHLGAVLDMATVGVTRRPLLAAGEPPPEARRGAVAPLRLSGHTVGFWVCTKAGTRPLVAHAGWRTSPETAVDVVLASSTPAARTPVPLQEARRVAREARSLAEGTGRRGRRRGRG